LGLKIVKNVYNKDYCQKYISGGENMKKFFLVLICFIAAFFVLMSGCVKNSPSAPGATSTPTPNMTQTVAALLTAGPSAQATATEQEMETATAQAQATSTAISQQATATVAAIETAIERAIETATAAVSQGGTVQGTLTLPSAKNGDSYGIVIVNDIYNVVGSMAVNATTGTLGSSTSVPYTLIAPAGTYYVFAYTAASMFTGPTFGDFMGIYGTVYPAFPSSPNVTVTKNHTTTANITMGTVTNSVSGTLTLPATISTTTNYIVAIVSGAPSFVDGQSYNSFNSVTSYQGVVSSGNQISYTLPNLLPGPFYVAAVVDVDNSTFISTGDYTGSAPITLNPANNQTKNFTLTTQP
jgi:hypothetical protein